MCPTEKLLKTTADEGRVEKSTGRCSSRGRSPGLQVVVRAEEARELVLLYRMKNRLYMVHDIQREVEYLKMLLASLASVFVCWHTPRSYLLNIFRTPSIKELVSGLTLSLHDFENSLKMRFCSEFRRTGVSTKTLTS